MIDVVTRFAPSPTGFLHIGGARTALFNYLFAKAHHGKFLLRIEDTDKERNDPEAMKAIIEGMNWLGLHHDDDIVYQSERSLRHIEIANQMLAMGAAYACYSSPEEIARQKAERRANGQPEIFHSPWRDVPLGQGPKDTPFVIRLKARQIGDLTINDLVQGAVTVSRSTLDDMIILRSDGSPTYMLAVVVDDYDMGVTHVIRGDDHLNNAFRQYGIYEAMGWIVPEYAHIPLIHDENGKKLSKRHGAAGLQSYRDDGILADAVFNYLLKMGWGHGDNEIISRSQARHWFNLGGVGKAPARLDPKRLEHLNKHYLHRMDDFDLAMAVADAYVDFYRPLGYDERETLIRAMPSMKVRATKFHELVTGSLFYFKMPNIAPKENLSDTVIGLNELPLVWKRDEIEAKLRAMADEQGVKLNQIVVPLRLCLTGSKISPPLFEVMEILGREETMARIWFSIIYG